MGRREDLTVTLRAYVAALNDGDVDAVCECVTPDFASEHATALGESFSGREEYRARLPAFFRLLPARRYDIDEPIVDRDRAAVPYTLHATAVTAGGARRPVVVRGVFVFHGRDGAIARRVDYWDSAEYQRQVADT